MARQPVKITVTSSIDKQISESVKLYDANTQRHLDRVANHLRNKILKGMKNTTTQSEPSKSVNDEPHYPSVEGFPPAIDTGRLANSIFVMRAMPFRNGDEHSSSVFTNVWYGRKLEEGINVGQRPFMGPDSRAYQDTERYANAIASDISINKALPKPAKGVKIR